MSTYNGFYLNAGPKLHIPLVSRFNQTMTNASVKAYDPILAGKYLENNAVYGQFSDAQVNGLKGNFGAVGKFALSLAAEAGYEFRSGLAIGGYIGCTLFSAYSGQAGSLVTITPPSDLDKGRVNMISVTQANPKGFGLFDLGVKISYNLDFDK